MVAVPRPGRLRVTLGKCGVCGGATSLGERYTAPAEDGAMVRLPSIECTRCGAIWPDEGRISELPAEHVPSAVRMRCVPPLTGGDK